MVYRLDEIAPPGLCPEAFHIAYPYCLGLLYGADFGFGNTVTVKCPLPCGGIIMRIESLPIKSPVKKIYNKIKWLINVCGYPADYIDKIIKIKVIKKGEACPYNYEESKYFELNTGDGCGICPASFDAIYPSICGILKGAESGGLCKGKKVLGLCPDHRVNVGYDLIDKDKGAT